MDWLCLCTGGGFMFILFMQQVMEMWMYQELQSSKMERKR